jgi:hypothetical protein
MDRDGYLPFAGRWEDHRNLGGEQRIMPVDATGAFPNRVERNKTNLVTAQPFRKNDPKIL